MRQCDHSKSCSGSRRDAGDNGSVGQSVEVGKVTVVGESGGEEKADISSGSVSSGGRRVEDRDDHE